MNTIGVIAGTPIDTQMGVELLQAHGFRGVGRATAANPQESTLLQVLSGDELTRLVSTHCSALQEEGATSVLIYCNSLSTAIDLPHLRQEHAGLRIVTPLDIYVNLAKRYRRLTILAANGQSLAGIERIFYTHNPHIVLLGLSLLPINVPIERADAPQSIVAGYRLDLIKELSLAFGSEAILLGCTHYPYFAAALQEKGSEVVLVDPALEMLAMLTE